MGKKRGKERKRGPRTADAIERRERRGNLDRLRAKIERQAGSIVYKAVKQESESTEEDEGTSKPGCSSKQEVAKGDPHHAQVKSVKTEVDDNNFQ